MRTSRQGVLPLFRAPEAASPARPRRVAAAVAFKGQPLPHVATGSAKEAAIFLFPGGFVGLGAARQRRVQLPQVVGGFGGPRGARTRDLLIANQALSQLS